MNQDVRRVDQGTADVYSEDESGGSIDVLGFVQRHRRGFVAVTVAVGLLAAGAFLAAWVQRKGWTYHGAPVLMLAPLALAAAAGRWLDAALPQGSAPRAGPVFGALCAVVLLTFAARGGEAPWRQIWRPVVGEEYRLTEWLTREAYGQRILVLSPDMFPVYPALNYARSTSTLRRSS